MKTKAALRLAPAIVVGGILTALAWGANAQEPAAAAATPSTTVLMYPLENQVGDADATTTSGSVPSVTTSDGKVFTDVKVLKVEGNKAILTYSGGVAWVALDSLSDDARKSLGLPTRQEQTVSEEKVSCHPGLPRLRGMNVPERCSDDDLRVLGTEWKANVVRWSTSITGTGRDLAEYDRWLDGELDKLDKALDACRRYGMKAAVYIDPPGGRYPDASIAVLYEPQYQDHWVAAWEKIARRYKGNPAIWGYNPISEPVQSRPLPQGMPDCTGAQVRLAKAIRAIDPDMPILIEVAPWDLASAFKGLKPVAISNVIYQVHPYEPHAFTHQGLPGYEKYFPSVYPGKINGTMWNKEQLRKELQPVRDFQLAHHVGIYAGEWSALRWAPGATNWLRDSIDLFEEYGWDWTCFCFREAPVGGWDGWSAEQGSDQEDHQPTQEPTDRKKLLLSWFAKNVQPARDVGTPAKP